MKPEIHSTTLAPKAALLKLQSAMSELAIEFMTVQGFHWIHSPRMSKMVVNGDNEFFSLEYFGQQAYLAQATQYHKQMALGMGLERVFDIGPLFRAEKRLSTRHMTEFTGLEFEMAFSKSYEEAIGMAESLLMFISRGIQQRGEKDGLLAAIQPMVAPAKGPIKLSKRVPRVTFLQAKQILRDECGMSEAADNENFSLEEEAALGLYSNQVLSSDILTIKDFPAEMRGFWSSTDPENASIKRAFDILLRGQEVVSGSQHIHQYEQLRSAMRQHEPPLDPDGESWRDYTAAFKGSMPPHAGCGIGMNRVLQGILGLDDIRDATAFPRDMLTLAP